MIRIRPLFRLPSLSPELRDRLELLRSVYTAPRTGRHVKRHAGKGLLAALFEHRDAERPHYEGHFGTDWDGKSYDDMTEAEHDEAAELWHY